MTSPAEVRKLMQNLYRDSSYSTNIYLPSVGSGRTLRETVLESSPVLALLNESFVSSWSLVKELESMQVKIPFKCRVFHNLFVVSVFRVFFPLKQADEQNHVLSEKARLHLEKYSFPVEMMVALPNGTIVNILPLVQVKSCYNIYRWSEILKACL